MNDRFGTWLAELDRVRVALHGAGERARRGLELAVASTPGLKVHSVTMREKDRESLARKLARPDKSYASLWDVTDLVGLRVVVYFEDDVDKVGTLVETAFPLVLEHSVDKRKTHDAHAFGYRSLHYVCRFAPEDGLPEGAAFEVQVRTVLEHGWAEIEHDLGYKAAEAVPLPVRRRLHRIASLLELADQEFVAIRKELDAYARSLPARVAERADEVALDRLSLESLLVDDVAVELDEAIAAAVGVPLGSEPFYPDYLVKMLEAADLRTVGDAKRALRERRVDVTKLVRPYFGFAKGEWGLAPEARGELPRGYSVFFVVHAVVLHGAELRIDSVQRLTRLYRTLDYPTDERSAARVAGRLASAFAGGDK